MTKPTTTLNIEIPDWQGRCAEAARDSLSSITADLAPGFREALLAKEYNWGADAIGTRCGIDFAQQQHEGPNPGESVLDMTDAAVVLDHCIPQQFHETDRGQWIGDTYANENGVRLDDLPKMVKSMATATLENVVTHYLGECLEHLGDSLTERQLAYKSENHAEWQPTDEEIEALLDDLIAAWEHELLPGTSQHYPHRS